MFIRVRYIRLVGQLILAYRSPLYCDSDGKGGWIDPYTDAQRSAFAAYAGASTKAMAGKQVIWEVWNEPNGDAFFNTASTDPNAHAMLWSALSQVTVPANRMQASGWGGFGVLDRSQQPKPAYHAAQTMSTILDGYSLSASTVDAQGGWNLEFHGANGSEVMRVVWRQDGRAPLAEPGATWQVLDLYGNAVPHESAVQSLFPLCVRNVGAQDKIIAPVRAPLPPPN